jgi:hypothetical protein
MDQGGQECEEVDPTVVPWFEDNQVSLQLFALALLQGEQVLDVELVRVDT